METLVQWLSGLLWYLLSGVWGLLSTIFWWVAGNILTMVGGFVFTALLIGWLFCLVRYGGPIRGTTQLLMWLWRLPRLAYAFATKTQLAGAERIVYKYRDPRTIRTRIRNAVRWSLVGALSTILYYEWGWIGPLVAPIGEAVKGLFK